MPTEYTLEIAGEEYPCVDYRYVRDYRFYGKLIEAIIPEWIAGIAGNDAIAIKRDGATVTSGAVKLVAPFEGVGKGMGTIVTGYTKEMKHATLLVNARTYNADPHDIIIDDLGSSDLTDGTTNLYGSNIVVELGSNDESKFNRKMTYNEVAFITGWEVYANPLGVLDFKSQCGVDRSTSVAFKHGELLESWIKPHTLNHLVKKTKVIVLGAFEGDFEFYGIAGVGTDVLTIPRKNLIDDNTCSLAAAAAYADMQNTLKTGAMNVIDTYAGAAYDVYDTVKVADPRFGLDEDVRLYRIERHVDKDGEHTKIFYTNITKLTGNGPYLLSLPDQHLETGQRVLRDHGRTSVNVIDKANLDSTGKIKADTCITEFGSYQGSAEIQSVGDDEWSESGVTYVVAWTGPLYPAIDGVMYVITNCQFDLNRGGSIGYGKGKMQYNLNGAGWVDFGTEQQTTAEDFTTYTKDPTDVSTAVNQTIQMRFLITSTIDGGTCIGRGRRPITMMYAKLYRRDIS